MAYLVKIDRRSIKKNPNAGSYEHTVAGPTTTTLSGMFIVKGKCSSEEIFESLDLFLGNREIHMHSAKIVLPRILNGGMSSFECVTRPIDRESAQKLTDELSVALDEMGCELIPSRMLFKTDRDIKIMRSSTPDPSHLYKYDILQVKCSECGLEFNHDQLKSDCDSNYDSDEIWSNEICPCCGAWDCCEISFEELTGDMIREFKENNG